MHLEPEKLTSQVTAHIKNTTHELHLSYASIWELQAKISAGRLGFEGGLISRIKFEQERNGLQLLPVGFAHLAHLSQIPFYKDHTDPFDRMLIAQAAVENMTLITADHKIQQIMASLFSGNSLHLCLIWYRHNHKHYGFYGA